MNTHPILIFFKLPPQKFSFDVQCDLVKEKQTCSLLGLAAKRLLSGWDFLIGFQKS